MSERLLAGGLEWLALALSCGVIVAAIGAATARSLLAMGMHLTGAGAIAAAALLAQGAPDASLGFAVTAAGLLPFLMLAAVLLSARAAKPRRGGRPYATIMGAVGVAGAVFWVLPDLGAAPANAGPAAAIAIAAWLAPLVFVAVAAAFALLGFGERGAFEPSRDRAS